MQVAEFRHGQRSVAETLRDCGVVGVGWGDDEGKVAELRAGIRVGKHASGVRQEFGREHTRSRWCRRVDWSRRRRRSIGI